MEAELSRALNDAVIRRLAGDQSYQRGRDYYKHGHVESVEAHAGRIRALVRGTQDYTVTLTSNDAVLDYSCHCPQGADGVFCKHCVAAALAWLNRNAAPAKSKSRAKVKEVNLADAGKILQAEDKDTWCGCCLTGQKMTLGSASAFCSTRRDDQARKAALRLPAALLKRPCVCRASSIPVKRRRGRVAWIARSTTSCSCWKSRID